MEGSWLPDPAGIRDLSAGLLKVVLPVKAALLWLFLLGYTDVSKAFSDQ